MKILLVEDDEIEAMLLKDVLSNHHYSVDVAENGQAGLDLATSYEYDLILIDWQLPILDGISLCRQLRSQRLQKPILLLTARNSSTDIVAGLDAGADDYIAKPPDIPQLLARIRALLRRGNTCVTLPILSWENLCLNPISGEVTYEKQPLHLTPKEYSLLELFLRNPKRVFNRSTIVDRLWSFTDSPAESAVTTHIKDLRQKLKAGGMTVDIIETVYGFGYRLKSPQQQQLEVKLVEHQQSLTKVNRVIEQFRHTLREQVAVLSQVKTAVQSGSISYELQQYAKQEAHKLAGSLGTFGYSQGSILAQEIEDLLARLHSKEQPETLQLQQLIVALEQELAKTPTPIANRAIANLALNKVLVIDDDVALTLQLQAEAVAQKVHLDVATNLTTARKIVAGASYDAILLDLTFVNPKEDGLDLLQEIAEKFPLLPVLVFTNRNSLADRVAVSRLGGRGFLSKPMSATDILSAISQVLPRTPVVESKVMVVDDDPVALEMLANLLRPWGLEVTCLQDSQQFWNVLKVTVPDLLLLDLKMPTFDGIDLCQVVRHDPQWGNLPILVVTAYTDEESIQQVFAAGADDFISKPVVGPELVTRVLSRIERVRWQQSEKIK